MLYYLLMSNALPLSDVKLSKGIAPQIKNAVKNVLGQMVGTWTGKTVTK